RRHLQYRVADRVGGCAEQQGQGAELGLPSMAQDGDQQPVRQRQGPAPQDAVPGAFVVQADRRIVQQVLLDACQQVAEGGMPHTGEGGVVQPVGGSVGGLGAVLVARQGRRCGRLGPQGVVPGGVPVVSSQRQALQDLGGDGGGDRVAAGVEFGVDGQPGAGGGGADGVDDDFVAGQGAPPA